MSAQGGARLRRGARLRERLNQLAPELRPIAVDVLTEASRIDVVAIDERGAAVALLDARGDDLACFTRALAATAWLESHLPDWCQISPQLRIDPLAPVRALVVANSFEPETRAAARLLGEARIGLLVASEVETRAPTPHVGSTAERAPVRPERPLRRPFRTGLSDADLGIRGS